jgi:hypothetical protein
MQVSEPRDQNAFCGGRGRILVISAPLSWPRKVRPLRLGNYNQDVTSFAIFCEHELSALIRHFTENQSSLSSFRLEGAGITPSGPHYTVVFPDRDQRIARPALYCTTLNDGMQLTIKSHSGSGYTNLNSIRHLFSFPFLNHAHPL